MGDRSLWHDCTRGCCGSCEDSTRWQRKMSKPTPGSPLLEIVQLRGDDAQFHTWMFTIARNRLIDWQRREGRRRSVAVAPEDLVERPADDDPAITAVDALRADAAVSLVRACLPRDQAEVILLRVVGGLDVGEVAAIVGKQPGNVRVLQHRGLRQSGREARRRVGERRGVTR